jgi:integrating conjugative element protein (TIGR03755 family)
MIRFKPTRIGSLLATLLPLSLPAPAGAQAPPTDDGLFYYTIGGGAPILPPASTETETVTIGASIEWGSNLTCGEFDPFVTVSNQLNGVTEGFQQMMSNVLQAATAAVASLPGLILQRANPGLYDLMQNGILQSKLDLEFAKTSCEQISRLLAEKLPTDDWTLVSTGQSWRQVAAAGADLIAAKEAIDASAGDAGLPWTCGELRGGAGQVPVSVNADTVTAGYNVLLNREPCDATAPSGVAPEESRLVTQWPTPAAAAEFAVEVLGDTTIQTCQGCARVQGTPGKGLSFVHDEAQVEIETTLAALVAGTMIPTADELVEISAPPGILVTRPLIEAIRADEDRDLIVPRLAGEIALARTLERALLVRRMLQAGKREPNVASIGPAQEALETSLADLTAEIDGLLYELNVREAITSNTAPKLLIRKQQRDLAAPQEVLLPPEPPFTEGAIRQ